VSTRKLWRDRELWKECVICEGWFVVNPDDPQDSEREQHADLIDCVRGLSSRIDNLERGGRYEE
jgi:hypothetical protein